jgi:hypothetical protein
VDNDEALSSITVKAVSTFDTGKSGTKTVTLTGGGGGDDDDDEESLADMDNADFGPSTAITRFTAGSAAEWNEAVTAIQTGGNDKNYAITLTGDFAIPGSPIDYGFAEYTFGETVTGITVSLRGSGSLGLGSNGSLITVGADQTLILRGPALKGKTGNEDSVVYIGESTAEFIMRRGTISGNSISDSDGGGVYVFFGTFTMSGGTISGNSITGGSGGGVLIRAGTFTMSGGSISGNSITDGYGSGGGVYVSGTFTMSGGTISGNSATSHGGGVYFFSYGSENFNMSGGTISGNSCLQSGGGVYFSGKTFIMSGGTISGNSCDFRGGGVQVSDGTFIKTGGTIYGSDATASNRNRADKNGWGHAVYKSGYPSVKYRDTTAGPAVNINTDDGTGLTTGSN